MDSWLCEVEAVIGWEAMSDKALMGSLLACRLEEGVGLRFFDTLLG